ncbi:class I SAM-dependent methyltransferase [Actinopolyspora biskrensis]|uniref:class I SAM-dependent methyltransferase n=1 Tax=Actinopolyspora biskrensis TaxID=1470178 RepID=UPI0031B5E8E7
MLDRVEHFTTALPESSTILDAGCGPGRDLARFTARGDTARGIDLNPEFVSMANARAPRCSVTSASSGPCSTPRPSTGPPRTCSWRCGPPDPVDLARHRIRRTTNHAEPVAAHARPLKH